MCHDRSSVSSTAVRRKPSTEEVHSQQECHSRSQSQSKQSSQYTFLRSSLDRSIVNKMTGLAPTVTLNNGRKMPVLGLGTWLINRDEGVELIKAAIDAGYRHFDTAMLYHSEAVIGEGVRQKIADGTVKREDIFITSKIWCSYAHPGLVVKACNLTLRNLGLDYVDLYLMHWPYAFKPVQHADQLAKVDFTDINDLLTIQEYFPKDASGNLIMADTDYVDTWKEMEECVRLGLAKSIGVSNFSSKQLDRLIQSATIKPVVNQVEFHAYLNQKKLLDFCMERGIKVTAYSPLCTFPSLASKSTLPKMLDHPTLVKIAQKKNKSPAQVALRFLIQLGAIVIPKTSNPKRLKENISVFDFELTPEEMSEMNSLNANQRYCIIPGTEKHKYYGFNDS